MRLEHAIICQEVQRQERTFRELLQAMKLEMVGFYAKTFLSEDPNDDYHVVHIKARGTTELFEKFEDVCKE